jgi:hypothetical protein
VAAVMVALAGQAVRTAPDNSAVSAFRGPAPANQAWASAAYRVEWEESHVPTEAGTKMRIAVPVTLRNIGNRVWPASAVFVAYHWLRDGRLILWDGERTSLPRDLEPGGRVSMSVRVTTPEGPGSYVLQITLVQELVTWFENKGADTVVRPVVIRPPTESADARRQR